jgi:threonyl-tRNA synthetase
MERFISILIEHTAGKFPLWLAPDQYALLPVSEKWIEYCQDVENQLKKHDIRGFIDDRNESVGKKIRDTELKKVPFMFIIGDKEVEAGNLSVRRQGHGDLGIMTVEEFAKYFLEEAEKDAE